MFNIEVPRALAFGTFCFKKGCFGSFRAHNLKQGIEKYHK